MRRQGFTLLEIMIVIIIIAILAAVALPKYNDVVDKSKVHEATGSLKTLAAAAYAYSLRTGNPPPNFTAMDVQAPVAKNFVLSISGNNIQAVGMGVTFTIPYWDGGQQVGNITCSSIAANAKRCEGY